MVRDNSHTILNQILDFNDSFLIYKDDLSGITIQKRPDSRYIDYKNRSLTAIPIDGDLKIKPSLLEIDEIYNNSTYIVDSKYGFSESYDTRKYFSTSQEIRQSINSFYDYEKLSQDMFNHIKKRIIDTVSGLGLVSSETIKKVFSGEIKITVFADYNIVYIKDYDMYNKIMYAYSTSLSSNLDKNINDIVTYLQKERMYNILPIIYGNTLEQEESNNGITIIDKSMLRGIKI